MISARSLLAGWQRLVGRLGRRTDSVYEQRMTFERAYFRNCETVHELPDIFHYWSNKYLRPVQEQFGFSNPEDFFFTFALRQCRNRSRGRTRLASIGAGNCDLEAKIAQRLIEHGQENFVIECVDVNEDMLDRGRGHARVMGVASFISMQRGDFNRWRPKGHYDVVIANQSLHHVVELEDLFATIKRRLAPGGVFITSDMIGRNGHVRWPEARKALQPFWDELPQSYRYNRLLQRMEPQLIDHDCSDDSFEGIRAQDILPLLVERFHFELFIPFGNIIFVFVERSFGHNFDAAGSWDRDFVDRVHARDEEGLLSGELKPTQMLAVLRNEPVETQLVHPRLTPEFCIRRPDDILDA